MRDTLVEGGAPLDAAPEWDAFVLSDTVMLVRTTFSRSRMYHAMKRRFGPQRLLVAPLSDDPKFMGMEAGVLKCVKRGGD